MLSHCWSKNVFSALIFLQTWGLRGPWRSKTRQEKTTYQKHQIKRLLCLRGLLCMLKPLGVGTFSLAWLCKSTYYISIRAQANFINSDFCDLFCRPFARHAHVILPRFSLPNPSSYLYFVSKVLTCSPVSATTVWHGTSIFQEKSNKGYLPTSAHGEKKKKSVLTISA